MANLKNVFIDIDETIAWYPPLRSGLPASVKYYYAKPIKSRIEKVNKWYDRGHKITYWTARGTGSGIDWTDVTEEQLDRWGCKYHELRMGKPVFDVFFDDKAFNQRELDNDYFKL
jgi:hypothetical protein